MSIVADILRHPSGKVLIGLGLAGMAAIGVAHTGGSENRGNGAIAVCTGEQEIKDISGGQTLEGLIEEYVTTNPKDKLKSDENLNRIARAIPKDGVDGEPLFVYQNNSSSAPELMVGKSFTIPTECKLK